MKLGLNAMRSGANFGGWGDKALGTVQIAQLAERLGYDSVWTAEVTGTDAIVPLSWIAAHTSTIKLGTAVMQMTARSPTTTAQTAATLDLLSEGRMILGLGPSGPGVVGGWHGQAYENPLDRTREYLDIVRTVLHRGRMDHQGEIYKIPYDGSADTDGGRLMFRPRRRRLPIYLAAMGPKAVSLAYEIADGFIPIFYSPAREDIFFDGVDTHGREDKVAITPFVPVAVGDDLDLCRSRVKTGLAFFIGAMGTKTHNFYNRYFRRLGYEDAAQRILDLYSAGNRGAAAMAVPDEFVDEVSLCGPRTRIEEQLGAWRSSKVDTMILSNLDRASLEMIAELVL